MSESSAEVPVKVVVWDLDGTVWDEVAVELPAGSRPTPRADVLTAMRRLSAAGLVNSIASRSAPEVLAWVTDLPELASLVVAPQIGWHDKSRSLALIATELGVAIESLLLVDDSPFERAQVAHALPAVRAMDRAQLLARLAGLLPTEVTAEASSRTELYRAEQGRRAAAASYDDREAFLTSCDLRLAIADAGPGDRARVIELAARAHRLSSTALLLDEAAYDAWSAAPDRDLIVGRLADRFGDYGLIALAAVRRTDAIAGIELVAVSCRVAGRGVPEAFLGELLRRAKGLGATRVELPIRATPENVELRLLVRSAGFALAQPSPGLVVASMDLGDRDAPAGPSWVKITAE